MITKRATVQFETIISAAQNHSLCIAECFDIKSGKKEYVLCSHRLEDGAVDYQPLAKLFQGNPHNQITPPGAAKYRLI